MVHPTKIYISILRTTTHSNNIYKLAHKIVLLMVAYDYNDGFVMSWKVFGNEQSSECICGVSNFFQLSMLFQLICNREIPLYLHSCLHSFRKCLTDCLNAFFLGCIYYTKKIIKSDFGATLVFNNQLLSLGVTFHGLRSR